MPDTPGAFSWLLCSPPLPPPVLWTPAWLWEHLEPSVSQACPGTRSSPRISCPQMTHPLSPQMTSPVLSQRVTGSGPQVPTVDWPQLLHPPTQASHAPGGSCLLHLPLLWLRGCVAGGPGPGPLQRQLRCCRLWQPRGCGRHDCPVSLRNPGPCPCLHGRPRLSSFWVFPQAGGKVEGREDGEVGGREDSGDEPARSDQPSSQGPGEPGHLVGGTPGGPPQRDWRSAGPGAPAAGPGGTGVSSPTLPARTPGGPQPPAPPRAPAGCVPPVRKGEPRAWMEPQSFPPPCLFSLPLVWAPWLTQPPPPPHRKKVQILGRTSEVQWEEMQGQRDPGGQGQGGGPSFKCPDSCPSVFCTHWSLGPTPKGATLSLRVAGSLGPRGIGRSGT